MSEKRYKLVEHGWLSYRIELDGQVQITGALFSNRDGKDVKALYEKAVNELNVGIERGCEELTLEAHRGLYVWNLKWHNQGFAVHPKNCHPGVYAYGYDLWQRGEDGLAFKGTSDGTVVNDEYPPIPIAVDGEFQNGLGYEKPYEVMGYDWSATFGRWGALVRFWDGKTSETVWTWPRLS